MSETLTSHSACILSYLTSGSGDTLLLPLPTPQISCVEGRIMASKDVHILNPKPVNTLLCMARAFADVIKALHKEMISDHLGRPNMITSVLTRERQEGESAETPV